MRGHVSGSLSRLSSGSLDITGSMQGGNQPNMIEMNKMKQECAALKLQVNVSVETNLFLTQVHSCHMFRQVVILP